MPNFRGCHSISRHPAASLEIGRLGWGLLSCVLALSAAESVHAQGIASNADAPQAGEEIRGDTRVALINEVERGPFVSVDYGPNYYFPLAQPGFVNLNPNALLPGTRMGVRIGYDVLNNIAIDGFLLANFNQGIIDPTSTSITGDLAHLAPGLGVRFAFITTDRVFAFARVGVGYAFWLPKELAGGAMGSLHTDASVGVEYYTKLRHLSIGVEADFQALIAPMALGVQVYPTLKYTFALPGEDPDAKTAGAGT